MTISQYARLALRESRRSRGRIGLFMACIAVGVAAVVVVAGLSTGVTDGIRAEGRRLMAADVLVESRRPLPEELDSILRNFRAGSAADPVRRADVREFVSVVTAGTTKGHLAELKVVEGGYPFYGTLRLDPDKPLADLLAPDAVVVASDLLERLGLSVGGEMRIGGAPFRVAGTVVDEPDKLEVTFTLGPRVFVSPAGLKRTALIDRGSRVEYRALLKLPEGASGDDADRLKSAVERGLGDSEFLRVRTFTEAQPQLRRSFDRMGRYLGLVGLLSLLVGGLGVAQVARAWLASRMDDIAILRCLGATPWEVVTLFLAQVVALALLGSLAGALLGTGLHWLMPTMLGGLLPTELIRPWQPAAILRGVGLGVAVALVFTLPLLAGLRRVPPVRVLRRDAEPVGAGWVGQSLGGLAVLAGVWLAATAQAESLERGTWFAGGLVVTVIVLAIAALAVSRIARLLPRDAGGVRLRHGLAHLSRHGAATVGAIVAMGLGVTFVFATRVVERHLSEQLRAELPADAPSTFFLDVQADQWPPLEALLRREGATSIDAKPIVVARFSAIDDVPVDQIANRRGGGGGGGGDDRSRERSDGGDRPRPRRWTLTREQRITYAPALPRGNRVIAGAFPALPGVPNGISIEEGFARDLGVRLGSKLTLDVQGVPVDLIVTSLRAVDWRTMGINFFLFAEPGPLNDAPQTRVAAARLPVSADLARVQNAVVTAFPNVTVIHIREVMDKVMAVLANLALAVKALGVFTVLAGVVVMGGAIAATQARRAKEVALLKTIGMTRADVISVFAIEYALTGLVAAIVGIASGALLGWAVITQMLELPWALRALEVLVAAGVTVALAVLAGLVASARALTVRPVEILRSE